VDRHASGRPSPIAQRSQCGALSLTHSGSAVCNRLCSDFVSIVAEGSPAGGQGEVNAGGGGNEE